MKLIFWLMVSFAPGWLGGKFKPGEWYNSLPKAPWTPPKLAFPIVWTILYILIGVSSWLVFRDGTAMKFGTLAIFTIQLLLNGLWSWIFFGKHQVGGALFELVLLWIAALATLLAFWKISSMAGGLLIPYLVWLSVAMSLNAYIWVKVNHRQI